MARRMTLDPQPEFPSASQVMMNLRRIVAEKSPKPWHEIMRLDPLGTGTDSSFRIYVLSPAGSDWYGDFTPQDAANGLQGIADELIAMHLAKVEGSRTPQPILDADGEVVANDEIVGQRREVMTAKGPVPVQVRRNIPRESQSEEESRLKKELAAFPLVEVDFDSPQSLIWNGFTWHVPTGPSKVPQPFIDVYRASKQSDRQARQRMAVTLDLGASETYIMNERRG